MYIEIESREEKEEEESQQRKAVHGQKIIISSTIFNCLYIDKLLIKSTTLALQTEGQIDTNSYRVG